MKTLDDRSSKLITSLPPRSPIAESYRTLRTNIQFAAVDKEDIKTILVTSTQPGEGKTVTSANLSIVMAQTELRTVYVHADLRRPTGHKIFNLQNIKGLTTYLGGQIPVEDIIQDTEIPNLKVITSGPIPPNPAELLASKKMEKFLAELKQHFDMIIIDTPPILAVTDATILSKKVDGCLLVVSSGLTSKEMATKAKQQLVNANATILGVILNNKKLSKKEYSNYYYYESDNKEEIEKEKTKKVSRKDVNLLSKKRKKEDIDPIKEMIEESNEEMHEKLMVVGSTSSAPHRKNNSQRSRSRKRR